MIPAAGFRCQAADDLTSPVSPTSVNYSTCQTDFESSQPATYETTEHRFGSAIPRDEKTVIEMPARELYFQNDFGHLEYELSSPSSSATSATYRTDSESTPTDCADCCDVVVAD